MTNLKSLQSTIFDALFLFKLLRSYLHHTYKIIAPLLLNQICVSMKPIKPCVVTRGLKFCDIYDVGKYACGAINDLIKPAELKNLLKSCGANDVYYYACGLSTIPTKPAEL